MTGPEAKFHPNTTTISGMKFIIVFIMACCGSVILPSLAGRIILVWTNWKMPARIGRILYGSGVARLSSQRKLWVHTSETSAGPLPLERFEIARYRPKKIGAWISIGRQPETGLTW